MDTRQVGVVVILQDSTWDPVEKKLRLMERKLKKENLNLTNRIRKEWALPRYSVPDMDVEPRTLGMVKVHLNILCGNSDREARDFRRFVCEKKIAGCTIIR